MFTFLFPYAIMILILITLRGEIMAEAELNFLIFLESLRNDFLNAFFEGITWLGEETVLVILLAVIYFAVDKKLAHKVFFITMISLACNSCIKNFVRAPRPFASGKVSCVRPSTATGYSFPSGHVQNFSTWSFLFAAHIKKILFTILVALLIILLAISRMYLGAHYPIDVVVGALLGIIIAYAGGKIYDKTSNKNHLYIGATIFFTIFAVIFMFMPDEHFSDFYKFYGMLPAFLPGIIFEEKYSRFDHNVSPLKKVLRVILGVAAALAIKGIFSKINVFDSIQITYLIYALRSSVIVFTVFALCPWLFKKFKF